MNIECHFIKPHSISNIPYCHSVICCNCNHCLKECICKSDCFHQESVISQENCCDTFLNRSKITYELGPTRVFNPISFCNNEPKEKDLSRNSNINLRQKCFRTSSDINMNKPNKISYRKRISDELIKDKYDILKKNNAMNFSQKRPYEPIINYKNPNVDNKFTNYRSYQKKRNNKYPSYRSKIRDLSNNLYKSHNDFEDDKDKKNKLLERMKSNKGKSPLSIYSNISDAFKIPEYLKNKTRKKINYNNLFGERKNTYDSTNQSKELKSPESIYGKTKNKKHNDDNDDDNKDYNSKNNETLAKIIIDKEIKNKNLEDQINKCKEDFDSLKNKYRKLNQENEKLRKINNESQDYKSELEDLEKNNKKLKNDINNYKSDLKDLERDNKELNDKIKKYKDIKNNLDNLNSENEDLKNENEKLRNRMKSIQKDYKKIISVNGECKTNFESLYSKYNDLQKKCQDVEEENAYLKDELQKTKKNNKKINDKYSDNDLKFKKLVNEITKYKDMDEEFDSIKNKYDEIKQKYNSLKNEYAKLKEKNEENENELNELRMKEDNNLQNKDNLNNKINKIKADYNELIKKYKILQKEMEEMKKENEEIMNENENLKEKLNEFSDKDEINRLKKEIKSLNEKIKKYEKEIEELKNNDNNGIYEDEIVIVNKECTFSKSGDGKEFNSSLKKKIGLSQDEIIKYHEIIQDLNNMILIYENLFFKKNIKPKNNKELFCYLLVEYLNRKINKIKMNVLVKLLIYKEIKFFKNVQKNNFLSGSFHDKINKNKKELMKGIRYRKGYSNERNQSFNNIE